VPAADPARWWGMAELTAAHEPVRPTDEPLELSGSAVEGLTQCGMRWFLTREAKGEQATSTAQGFGLAVHVLAAEVVDQANVDADELVAHLDAVWHRLDYETPWIAGREREEATAAVRRFVRWHLDRGDRAPVGAEVEFVVEVSVGDDVVRLRGSMDRVEVDADGRVHIVDFKTGRGKPSAEELARHAQLGVYQVAVGHGAIPAGAVSGGAELVQLRQEFAAAPGSPVVQAQAAPAPDEPFFAYELLRHSVDAVRDERFHATVNSYCAMCAFRRMCPAHIESTLAEDA
jgi:RecB family exonuclease